MKGDGSGTNEDEGGARKEEEEGKKPFKLPTVVYLDPGQSD